MLFDRTLFPDYFPDGCPPEDAQSMVINAYRLCKNNPATAEDFMSHFELSPRARFSDMIKAHGLSLLTNQNDLKNLLALPALKKKYSDAWAAYGSTCNGAVKLTPSSAAKSHITWWLYKDYDPRVQFRIVDRVN